MLASSAWGKGYATEIGRALKRYAFEERGIERLVALIEPDSAASERVAVRGVLTETPSLDEQLSARENLTIYARLYGVAEDATVMLVGLSLWLVDAAILWFGIRTSRRSEIIARL